MLIIYRDAIDLDLFTRRRDWRGQEEKHADKRRA
jgi:hypothetical protein